jgi:hypothetical protein
LVAENAQLAETSEAPDPELVAVFDLAGTVDRFLRACEGIDGLEFLADLQEDQVAADDDFYYEDQDDVSDDGVPQSLYMVMSNAEAVRELVRLFELWQQDPSVTFARGLNPLKQVFELLRAIRRWGPDDRIRETGLLEDWEDTVSTIGSSGVARVEVELWYRSDPDRRAAVEAAVVQLIDTAGGQVVRTSAIPGIQFHGLLADIPYDQVRAVLDDGPDAIELLTAESVMFVTPARPMALPAPRPTTFGLADLGTEPPEGPPRIALLDGLPFANHVSLQGRLVIDDPTVAPLHTATASRTTGPPWPDSSSTVTLRLPVLRCETPCMSDRSFSPIRGFAMSSWSCPMRFSWISFTARFGACLRVTATSPRRLPACASSTSRSVIRPGCSSVD